MRSRVVNQLEPEEAVRSERHEVGQLADGGKGTRPTSSTGVLPAKRPNCKLDRLGESAQVVDAQHDVAVARGRRRPAVPARRRAPTGSRPRAPRSCRCRTRDAGGAPASMRRIQCRNELGVAHLALDVDRLEAVHRVHQRRQVELGEVGPAEAGVAVGRPLHRACARRRGRRGRCCRPCRSRRRSTGSGCRAG